MPIRRHLASLTAAAALAMTCGRSPLEIDYGPTPGTAGSTGPGTAGSGGGAGATGQGGSTGGSVSGVAGDTAAAGTFGRGGTVGAGGSAAAGTFGRGGTIGSGGSATAGTFGRGGMVGRGGAVGAGGRGTAGTFGRGGTTGTAGTTATAGTMGRGGTTGSAGTVGTYKCPTTVDGILEPNDVLQTGRENRVSPAGFCGVPKAYPNNEADPTSPHFADVYRFVNPAADYACFNFTLTYDNSVGLQRYMTAYVTYDPANIGTNYLGDVGAILVSPQTMGITVPPMAAIEVVVFAIEVAPNGFGNYTLSCATPSGAGGRGGTGGVVDGGAGVGGSINDGGAGAGGSSGGTGGQPPNPIPCGRMSCVPGVEACCIRQNNSSCIKANATCPGGASISCLDGTACSGGNLCCLNLGAVATSCVPESTCTAPGDVVLCSSPAHCPGTMPNCCRLGQTGLCSAQLCP